MGRGLLDEACQRSTRNEGRVNAPLLELLSVDSELVYKAQSRRLRREHRTRLMSLAVCAALYGRFNASQGNLDREIDALKNRFSHRFPKLGAP
jgi:hypothetical protein